MCVFEGGKDGRKEQLRKKTEGRREEAIETKDG